MSHVLVAGGTGMLKDVVLYFASHGMNVSVIARDPEKFEQLILSKGSYGLINPLRVDYTDYEILNKKLSDAIGIYGPVETAVVWINSTISEAVSHIAENLNSYGIPVKFYHILGSEHVSPDSINEDFNQTLFRYKNISYRKIILGFVTDDKKSRWLTNIEICNGVIDALKKDDNIFIVGKTEPWNNRP